MLIIPAIDLRGGRCVRLAQGDYGREKVYDQDPLRVARSFHDQGAEWVHVVDLDGAKTGTPLNLGIVGVLARESGLRIEFGGGVRSAEAAESILDLGVERVVLGTKLVQSPELSEELFRRLGEAAVAGIDARGGKVASQGWTEDSGFDAIQLARTVALQGARRVILTDIARDGMMNGPNLVLLKSVQEAVSVPVIQSGGVSGIEDLEALAALRSNAPEAVIVGRAIYEGRLDLSRAFAALA